MATSMFSDDLMMEILSWLPVISLLRFKCVCKSFLSFISDPKFVKLHLERSPKNAYFLAKYKPDQDLTHDLTWPIVLPCPKISILDDSLSQIIENEYRYIDMKYYQYHHVLGSCNGLVCLYAQSNKYFFGDYLGNYRSTFLLWNPATRQMFVGPKIFVRFSTVKMNLGFGYDNVSDTYKVVAIVFSRSFKDGLSTFSNEVKICNISENNSWRNIQSFPGHMNSSIIRMRSAGVYLKNTLNWIALAHPPKQGDIDGLDITFGEIVIVSLDLGNETFTQISLPSAYSRVPVDFYNCIGYRKFNSDWNQIIGVLKDRLSFFLHHPKIDIFVIWQMKEFGNAKSWSPMFRISPRQYLQLKDFPSWFCLQPLCEFEDGTILIISNTDDHQLNAILLDYRDNTIKCSQIPKGTIGFHTHVQSLVFPRKY